ncbi:MAG TPA: ATP-binding cassette domain-containing protein [Gammaproteobacteria bacterium]|nr:ATP-binding cassette domain-containing protein [Gammaproteobacteria bacterium]
MISLNGIEKVIKKGNRVVHTLKGITLNIEQGEIFGILGHAGAGKSALIRTINFLDPPSRGSVVIDSCDLSTLSAGEIREARRHIGMIFEHFNLLNTRTVFENVAFPLELLKMPPNKIAAQVRALLNLTGLSDKAEAYPYQLNSEQKQRVAIARALANEPKVLLCEEATHGLDQKAKQSILQLLREINSQLKLTVLLITHEIEVIKSICNRVAVLHDGEIVEQNTVIEWYSKPKTDVSKTFIRVETQSDIPASLGNRLLTDFCENTNLILRLSFSRTAAEESFIALVIQQFPLSVNIIQAHLETFQMHSVGIMIVEMVGERTEVNQAITFLEHKDIHTEVIGYVTRTA